MTVLSLHNQRVGRVSIEKHGLGPEGQEVDMASGSK